MKIGIDAKRIFFNSTGLGNYSRRFYNCLSTFAFQQDEIYLYSNRKFSDNKYCSELNNFDKVELRFPTKWYEKLFGGALWRSYFINKQLRSDKISIFYGVSNEIPLRPKHSTIVTVAIIHDLIFLKYPELYPALDVIFYKMKVKYACRHANFIISASQQTKDDLIDLLKVSPEKITVIHPACDPIFYEKSDSVSNPTSAALSLPKKYLLSLGAITPRKNQLLTVKAFQAIKEHYDLDLVIVGNAVGLGKHYLKEIKDYIAASGIEDCVHFLNNVPNHDIPALYRGAEILIYPSIYEGFGMPIVESLMCGTPVIATQGGCFEEAGGNAAFYLSSLDEHAIAEKIELILKNPELKTEKLESAKEHLAQFKVESITSSIKDFHNKVAKSFRLIF
ncbi:MAG: glycosyltransferase family 4 protein [Saprospiraceae bacterium]|nr:glycosyltransferase family 4 protein [Saprospiraceae bacterium]